MVERCHGHGTLGISLSMASQWPHQWLSRDKVVGVETEVRVLGLLRRNAGDLVAQQWGGRMWGVTGSDTVVCL